MEEYLILTNKWQRLVTRILIEEWRKHYNQIRLHSALGYESPAPEVIITENTNLKGGPIIGGQAIED